MSTVRTISAETQKMSDVLTQTKEITKEIEITGMKSEYMDHMEVIKMLQAQPFFFNRKIFFTSLGSNRLKWKP